MRRSFILFLITIFPAVCFAQQTVEQSDKLAPGLSAKYHVLKSNYNIKEGIYQVLYKQKTVVASGMYQQGKKTGVWHFYDPAGKLVQHYNYDTKRLIYEAAKDTASYKIEYVFDQTLKTTDTLTRPVKIGGVFYGYLPYLNAFRIAHENRYDPESYYAVIQILVSPAGRLADCKLYLRGKLTGGIADTYVITDDLLTEDDKTFIPATLNGNPVSSNIFIVCKLLPNWRVSIY